MRALVIGFYVYAFYIATYLVKNKSLNFSTGEPYSAGEILTVMVALMTGLSMFLTSFPNIQSIIKAKVIGRIVFDVIDRQPAIQDK